MFDFINKWFRSGNKKHSDRQKFLETVHLMLDGEASPEQQQFVMEKISCCQFSNSKYELEKCIREKLKSLYCCKETPNNLDKLIIDKITSTQNQPIN